VKNFEQIALDFARALVNGAFGAAHDVLSADLKAAIPAAELGRLYRNMLSLAAEQPDTVEVIETMRDWPDKQPHDVGWAYVAISGKTFSEAVTVIVVEQGGALCIRSVEWGRP
jgi:hypothetical protein